MKKIKNIENKIHIVNPDVTDEFLDLLYEYVLARLNEQYSYSNMVDKIQSDETFEKALNSLVFKK